MATTGVLLPTNDECTLVRKKTCALFFDGSAVMSRQLPMLTRRLAIAGLKGNKLSVSVTVSERTGRSVGNRKLPQNKERTNSICKTLTFYSNWALDLPKCKSNSENAMRKSTS